ncbi:MAG: methionine--tRNA ligase [Candidatus Rokubacteria bacterium]|nr:methionine--tRNA ligase [Candidatus Rokubacteria bacterium]MBI3825118.1 methionine--tRNA ligase [Candidatus Rokubacteria bacterium]
MSDVVYLTTPIYYPNGPPHLGHAYTTIVADAMARYRRLRGDRVFFLTGTDEHGDKIAQAAAKAGVTPQAMADQNSAAFREAWRRLGISNDDFIRTTEERHQTIVRRILQTLWDKGEIYFGKYGGQYCFGCERYYTETELKDTGGTCPDHETPLTHIEEENYFFKMSRYQDWLIRYIQDRPDLIRPERYRNEILGFLREPLQDLSISRPRTRLQWGIPLPFDDRFVTYVWFDALINYVSALGPLDGEKHLTFWPVVQHLIGKDILKAHGVYWPCMLKAADLPIYTHLEVHGFWRIGGGKMSKSVGNVVEALALSDTYGNDAFRYFLMREMVFGLDADFSEEAFVGRLNADLANDLGNLVSRATTLMATHGGGVARPLVDLGDAELGLKASFATTVESVEGAMEKFAFHAALAAIWEFIAKVNRYVDASAPWALAKSGDTGSRERLEVVLSVLGESLRCLSIVLSPFLPRAAMKMREALGESGDLRLADAAFGGGTKPVRLTASKLSGLFPRVEDKKPGARASARSADDRPGTGLISIDDFGRVELRVAEVVAAEAVPKSKKLLKLTLSLGAETRTVAAGIAEHYAPADLVGKKIVVVTNLQPVTLMGVQSQGMLLAGSAEGRLAVITLDRDLPPGAKVE